MSDDEDWLDLLGADGVEAGGGGSAVLPVDVLSKAELAAVAAHEAAEKKAAEDDESDGGASAGAGATAVPEAAAASSSSLFSSSTTAPAAVAAAAAPRQPMVRKPEVDEVDGELALLLNKVPSESAAATAGPANAALLAALAEGRFLDVLISPEGAALLAAAPAADGGDGGKESAPGGVIVEGVVQKNAAAYLDLADNTAAGQATTDRLKTVLYVGIGALQLFRQANWTGPPVDPAAANAALLCIPSVAANVAAAAAAALVEAEQPQNKKGMAGIGLIDALEVDGETALRLVRLPALLLASRALLKVAAQPYKDAPSPKTAGVWLARCMFAHQQTLESPVAPLHDQVFAGMASAVASGTDLSTVDELCSEDLPAQLLLELGMYHSHYKEVNEAKECWIAATDWLGVEIELSGAMGIRTKFQTIEKAQLILKVKHGHSAIVKQSVDDLPKALDLNDDTRLEKVGYTDEGEFGDKDLSACEQATIMAMCMNVKNQNPVHGLTTEEMHPHVDHVLAAPTNWAVQSMALMTRSELEFDQMRSRHRTSEQLSQMVLTIRDDSPPAATRLAYLSTTAFPPVWQMEKKLAMFNLSMGLTRDALGIFSAWEMWDNMLACYQLLDQDTLAEELVRARLTVEPSANLWCVLGDIKRDEAHYHQAWEVSKGRSARAARSLGRLYLMRGEKSASLGATDALDNYRKAFDNYKLAVGLNQMRADAWFSLGCSALRLEEWPVTTLPIMSHQPEAVQAFRRKLDLDQDDFQAWNNLGHAYIKLKQNRRAFYALKEATKYEYQNWKVWDNICGVSLDIGAFPDTIIAANRVLDLRKSFDDWQVLSILIASITSGDEPVHKWGRKSGERLKKQLKELVERVQASSKIGPKTWGCCAEYYLATGDAPKGIECRRSAYQEAKAMNKWEEHDEGVKLVSQALACYLEDAAAAETPLKSAKLLLTGVLKLIRRSQEAGYDTDVKKKHAQRLDAILADLTAA